MAMSAWTCSKPWPSPISPCRCRLKAMPGRALAAALAVAGQPRRSPGAKRIAASALVALAGDAVKQRRPALVLIRRAPVPAPLLALRAAHRPDALRQRLTQAEAPLADLSVACRNCSAGERQQARWTGRSSPVPWPPVPVSASSPAAPAPAKPPPWCACWPCCRGRQWSRAGRCASAWPRRPARRRRA